MKTKVLIASQNTYNLLEIEEKLRVIFKELKLEQLLENKQKILLKPNMLGAHHPDKAVTTHPVILEAVLKILQDYGKVIIVGDSPGGIVKARQVWEVSGYTDICNKYNVKLVDFGKDGVIEIKGIKKNRKDVRLIIDKNVMDCDAIINLPKMKTHSMMLYTGAVKNLYGVIPGLYKSELHKEFQSPNQFAEVLSELYSVIKDKIVLNIMDGVIGMDGDGPSAGKPALFGLILVSEKASILDYYASKMMGFKLKDLQYLQSSLNSDNFLTNNKINFESIEIEKKWENFFLSDIDIKSVIFRNKFLNKIPPFLKKCFSVLFTYYPDFLDSCKLCEVCIKSCPVQALKLSDNKDKVILTKKDCIKCLCCHEMCPYSAITIKKSLISRLVFKN